MLAKPTVHLRSAHVERPQFQDFSQFQGQFRPLRRRKRPPTVQWAAYQPLQSLQPPKPTQRRTQGDGVNGKDPEMWTAAHFTQPFRNL